MVGRKTTKSDELSDRTERKLKDHGALCEIGGCEMCGLGILGMYKREEKWHNARLRFQMDRMNKNILNDDSFKHNDNQI